MRFQEDRLSDGAVLACDSGWTMFPFSREFARSNQSLLLNSTQSQVGSLLSAHDVGLAFCSPERLLRNSDFELALPIGEVLTSSCQLAYLALEGEGDEVEELKGYVSKRIEFLKEIFSQVGRRRYDDPRAASLLIWNECAVLEKPISFKVPTLRLPVACDSYTTLARMMYRLLFGVTAYESNERLLTSGGGYDTHDGVRLELKSGNDALVKRSQYYSVIDLIDLWWELTEEPFIASVLQKSKRAPVRVSQLIVQAAELAQARMKVEPSNYLPDIVPLNCHGGAIDLSYLLEADKLPLGR